MTRGIEPIERWVDKGDMHDICVRVVCGPPTGTVGGRGLGD